MWKLVIQEGFDFASTTIQPLFLTDHHLNAPPVQETLVRTREHLKLVVSRILDLNLAAKNCARCCDYSIVMDTFVVVVVVFEKLLYSRIAVRSH